MRILSYFVWIWWSIFVYIGTRRFGIMSKNADLASVFALIYALVLNCVIGDILATSIQVILDLSIIFVIKDIKTYHCMWVILQKFSSFFVQILGA